MVRWQRCSPYIWESTFIKDTPERASSLRLWDNGCLQTRSGLLTNTKSASTFMLHFWAPKPQEMPFCYEEAIQSLVLWYSRLTDRDENKPWEVGHCSNKYRHVWKQLWNWVMNRGEKNFEVPATTTDVKDDFGKGSGRKESWESAWS